MRTVGEAAEVAALARRYGLRRVADALWFAARGPLAAEDASHEPAGRARGAVESAGAMATTRMTGGASSAPTGHGLLNGARAP